MWWRVPSTEWRAAARATSEKRQCWAPVLSLTALSANAIYSCMATLTVRNLPDDVRNRLRVRAAENGRSMEAEVRDVLSAAVRDEAQPLSAEDVKKRVRAVQKAFRPYKKPGESVVDDFLAERRRLWGRE